MRTLSVREINSVDGGSITALVATALAVAEVYCTSNSLKNIKLAIKAAEIYAVTTTVAGFLALLGLEGPCTTGLICLTTALAKDGLLKNIGDHISKLMRRASSGSTSVA